MTLGSEWSIRGWRDAPKTGKLTVEDEGSSKIGNDAEVEARVLVLE
jgi:hypothetical protein